MPHVPNPTGDESPQPARASRRPGRPPASGAGGEDVATRERVLRDARRLFMRRGFADVSMGEVARATGVTKPTLYYHFGDKQGLYAEVICSLLCEVGGYVRQVTETDQPVRARLYELALGYFRHADYTMEPMLRDVTALLGPQRSARVWDTYQRAFVDPIEALMRDGARRGDLRPESDAEMLRRAFLALLEALTAPGGHTARSDAQHQAVAAAIVGLFLDGAADPAGARSVLSS
jgi:AcrR family transcriptional regulator